MTITLLLQWLLAGFFWHVPEDAIGIALFIVGACLLAEHLAKRKEQMPAIIAVESLEAELEFIDGMMQSHLPSYDKDKAWLVERNLKIAREQLRLAGESIWKERWSDCLECAEHGMVQVCLLRRTLGIRHEL
ncbi:MAG TPA: hypothetical protein PLC15_02190 [Candidatus Obscuribacter sp.]|nr:hypothetical protein [Candidatus Obscuribacter sp.]MBK9282526.1 hypothetical protein [Candidatus Obscuribacter sp.]HMW89419.1 hypothetical protein [Candidatus Obscuribacter sp.]HMX44367.1 hypothetical protein [Candidatus Obscuribacter sp.]HMY52332.1 hypothetical protein [Candidatus Obscuribacter sp.]